MKNYTLAIIGCGNMAQSIIRALCNQSANDTQSQNENIKIIVADIDEKKLSALDCDIEKTTDNVYAVSKADCVLLAIKPQIAIDVIKTLKLHDKIIVSIMAGMSISKLQQLTKSNRIVRVMPNLNARIFKSYNAYACEGIDDTDKPFIKMLLNSFGYTAEVAENKLNAVTGLTGSSPAFVFMFIKAIIDEGVAMGFDVADARRMAVAAVEGSAGLVRADESDMDLLIDSVCSKGGTTIEGVKYLRDNDFERIVRSAIGKSFIRAKELSGE